MTDYTEEYRKKRITAEEAAGLVRDGWTIGMDAALSQTPGIMAALCERAKESGLRGVKVQTLLDAYPFAFYADDSLNGSINGVVLFRRRAQGDQRRLRRFHPRLLPGPARADPRQLRLRRVLRVRLPDG